MRNIFLSLFFITSLKGDVHTIAVLDFSGENIHQDELKSLSAIFRTELLQMDTLRVLDYDDMTSVLMDYSGSTSWSSIECAVIASMILDQEWLVTAHVSKIGEVFLIEARLIESSSGRIINAVSYDYELSLEGLYTRGMHILSEIVLSKRIPLEIHKRQNLVYFKTNPSDAMIRVGKDTLSGTTPLAIDRVGVESRPIIVFKNKVFNIKPIASTILDYTVESDDPHTLMIMLTGRLPQQADQVEEILNGYNILFDEYHYKDEGDTLKSKLNTIQSLLHRYTNVKFIEMYEDRVPHAIAFEEWGKENNVNIKVNVVTDAQEAFK